MHEREKEPGLEPELEASRVATKTMARARLRYIDIKIVEATRAIEDARRAIATPGEISDKDWETEVDGLERNIKEYERARQNIEDRMPDLPE